MVEKEKKAEQPTKEYEVTIMDRTFLTVFPRLREEQRQVVVTYVYADFPPRAVTIDLRNLFAEAQFEAERQIVAKSGDLFKKYVGEESKTIREDIEKALVFKPEVITV